MYLSIIIPAFNEEARLGLTLEKIHNYLKNKTFDYEVILIDDGSTDKTYETAAKSSLSKDGKLKIIKNSGNHGKGYAVKQGMLESKAENVLFTDADLSTPIEEIEKLLPLLESGYDIAIGSRAIDSSLVKIRQPIYREYMGKLFNKLVHIFAIRGVKDTQCGFKLFKKSAAKTIAPKLKINGFAFDVEILFLAKKLKFKVSEAAVIWINSSTSKVNPLSDSSKMFFELLNIRRLHQNED